MMRIFIPRNKKRRNRYGGSRWFAIGVMLAMLLVVSMMPGCSDDAEVNLNNSADVQDTSCAEENADNQEDTYEGMPQTENTVFRVSDIILLEEFSDGYAWVKVRRDGGDVENDYYYMCVDAQKNIAFDDRNGLYDADGNKFCISKYFKKAVETTYEFEGKNDAVYTIADECPAYNFNDGFAMILCTKEDVYYACLIDTQGKVLTAIALQGFDPRNIQKDPYTNELMYPVTYYNGYGTYWVSWDTDYCVSAEKGVLFSEQDENTACYPIRGGKFYITSLTEGFDFSENKNRIINGKNEILSTDTNSFLPEGTSFYYDDRQFAFFLNENLAYIAQIDGIYSPSKIHTYYNIANGREFSVVASMGSVAGTGKGGKLANQFGYDTSTVHLFEVICESYQVPYEPFGDGWSYTTEYKYLGYLYEITADGEKNCIFETVCYNEEPVLFRNCVTDKYCLLFTDEGLCCVSLEDGSSTILFADYSQRLRRDTADVYILVNGLVYAEMQGKDHKCYYAITQTDGTMIAEPTLIPEKGFSTTASGYSLGTEAGILYENIFYRADGTEIMLDEETQRVVTQFKDGWAIVRGLDYMDINGSLFFEAYE